MRSCPSCAAPGQHDGARFCFNCAAPLPAPGCPACGSEVPPGAKFCPECAAPQTGAPPVAASPAAGHPVASRRVTSVLFGDLVGFTALSETRDQEDVRELLSSYFEQCSQVIARYGGTVEKFIGDAVMAVWGVPTAHEDDAERAVRAGLELVHLIAALGNDLGVPDLAMRVGIVTGEVAVTVGAAQQGMVAGDAVNTAARVQSAAAPGQVWVDETTRLLTSSAVTYVDVGSHAMKGKADPMPLWAVRAVVAGMGGAQRADGLEAPHVGRDRELRLVKELFHSSEEAHRPTLLVVSGEAGVGKSRLGWELDKYTDGLNTTIRWHKGRCLSYGEGVAFYALAEAIRARLQIVRAEDELAEASEGFGALLEDGLAQYVADPDERSWLEPRLGALLGTVPAGGYKREDLFSAWTTFLHRVSGDGEPVVLLIDDAQHADDGLLDFVEHLLAVGTFPCFVVLLARPALLDARPTLATNRRAHVLHLDTLSDADMGVLLDGLVVGLPDATRTALVQRAEGIPLYAVETVRSLIDRDLVVPRGGQYVLADASGLDLDAVGAPASLQSLIAARLDTLAPELRRVVDQASVLGNSFSREAIGGLCPDVPDLEGALAQLVRLQLLGQESSRFSAEVGQFRFVQSAVRQVAYGTLSRRDRKASHLAVVRQLEQVDDPADELAPIIAQHYLEALDAVPGEPDSAELASGAVHHLRRAARRAAALGASAEAAGHLTHALERAVDPVDRASIELELGRQLQRAGDHEGAVTHATSARDSFDELDDPVAAGFATAVLAEAVGAQGGDHQAAIRLAEDRLALLRGREDTLEVQLALLVPLIAARYRVKEDIRDLVDEQLRLAEKSGDDTAIADGYMGLSLHYLSTGTLSVGRTLLQTAAEIARHNHDLRLRTRALANLNAFWSADDLGQAIRFGQDALAESLKLGDTGWTSAAATNLTLALTLEGSWAEAQEILRRDLSSLSEAAYWEATSCYLATGRGERWSPSPPPEVAEPLTDIAAKAFRLLARAIVADAQGDGRAATTAAEAVETIHEDTQIFDDFVTVLALAAPIAVEARDRTALGRMTTIVDGHHPSTHSRGLRALRAHHRAIELIWDDAEPALVESALCTALVECDTWGSRLVRSQVASDLGVWLTRQGRAGEAVEHLDAARAQFAQMGATAHLSALDARLSGVRA